MMLFNIATALLLLIVAVVAWLVMENTFKHAGYPVLTIGKTSVNHCDGGHETDREIRKLPHSRDPNHGNDLLCMMHYTKEMRSRREMINSGHWSVENTDLPDWSSLEVVDPAVQPPGRVTLRGINLAVILALAWLAWLIIDWLAGGFHA